MTGDALILVCVILAGILAIGVSWQAMNAWLDHREELDRRRRADARARRYRALTERNDNDGPLW